MSLPALNENDVNIFLLKDNTDIDTDLITFYYANLSKEEKQKYHKFHFEKDKRLYLISHAMLRLVLSHYIGCSTQSISFKYNSYGKPSITDHSEISFNLSHSKQAIALVLNNGNNLSLGIDIESHKNRGEVIDLAFNYFSTEECELLKNYSTSLQNEIFFKLWTLKESYIKAIGKGLSIDLNKFTFNSLDNCINIKHYADEDKNYWQFSQSRPYQDYLLALAIRSAENNIQQLKVHTFEYCPGVSCVDKPLVYVTSQH